MYTSEADISKYRYIAVFERISVKKQSFFSLKIFAYVKKKQYLCTGFQKIPMTFENVNRQNKVFDH